VCCVASYNEHVKPLGKKEMNFKRWLLNVNNVCVIYLLTEYQSQWRIIFLCPSKRFLSPESLPYFNVHKQLLVKMYRDAKFPPIILLFFFSITISTYSHISCTLSQCIVEIFHWSCIHLDQLSIFKLQVSHVIITVSKL